MGGRGANSGVSIKGNKYGSQYHTILQNAEIKFVQKNTRQSEDLMETMTPGRIYATVGGNEIIRITFFDDNNKRKRVIEKDKRTGEWHVHKGYLHSEYSENHRDKLDPIIDKPILDRVLEQWQNRK